jgi:hypothetical protein
MAQLNHRTNPQKITTHIPMDSHRHTAQPSNRITRSGFASILPDAPPALNRHPEERSDEGSLFDPHPTFAATTKPGAHPSFLRKVGGFPDLRTQAARVQTQAVLPCATLLNKQPTPFV